MKGFGRVKVNIISRVKENQVEHDVESGYHDCLRGVGRRGRKDVIAEQVTITCFCFNQVSHLWVRKFS